MRFCFLFLILFASLRITAQQLDSLIKWSDQLMRSHTDSAIQLARQAEMLAREQRDTLRQVKAIRLIAFSHDVQGDLEKSKHLLYRVLSEFPRMGKGQEAAIFNSLGIVFMKEGSNDSAAIALFKSLEMRSELGDSVEIASTYGNIGLLYSNSGDFEKSREYNERALEIKKRIRSPDRSIAATYINLGLAVGNLNQNVLEQEYYEKALQLLIPLRDHMSISMIYNNIGWNYHHIYRNFDSANYYYRQALKARTDLGDILGQAQSLSNLAEMSVDFGRFSAARALLNESHQLAMESGSWREIYRVLQVNATLLEKIGDYQEALSKYRLAIAYEDSINNQATKEMLADIEAKYLTEQKERKIAEQNAEIQTQKASLATQKSQILALIGSLIIISLSAGIFYTRYRARQETRLQQAIIQEKERGIEAVFSATEEEQRWISRELHDGIGPRLNGVRLGMEALATGSEEELRHKLSRLTENLQRSANEIRSISHRMMPKELTDSGLACALEELIVRTFEFSKIQSTFSHHGVMTERFPELIEISLYRIAQELLNNVIRHAEANRVALQFYQVKRRLILTVEDNGTGFKEEAVSGHGVLNIRTRLAMISGRVNYESAGDSGTLVTVSVPLP